MNTINLVLCGLGGQGILFMTKALSQAAIQKGYDVMGAETHGMAQRGGSVVSHLRLGDVQGSLVLPGSAQLVLALEENEGYKNLPFVAPAGRLFVNTSSPAFPNKKVKDYLDAKGIQCRGVPASSIAIAMGTPMSSNLALLGYFSASANDPFSHEDLRLVIQQISPDRLKEKNLMVFDAGFDRGMEEKKTLKA
ncbi:MAG: indolepyruvate oxidoreductase subunit beta [Euryarchaeota archaeon]|nr:indolepyruvate oxidoreductase subunit beta [Euryarchaeota archaeon]